MRVGIIGSGAIGGYLARSLTQLGHSVSIANSRGPESLQSLAAETGATPLSVAEVVLHQDVVIVSIPEKAVLELPSGLFQSASPGTVVIDTGNYYPSFRDGAIEPLDSLQLTESEWVARQLHRPVVKAFNSIMARSLVACGVPAGQPHRIALPVAGDDAKAKETVIGLVEALGFDGVDAGTLAESWKFQPGTPAYCTDLDKTRLRGALEKAEREKASRVREESMKKILALPKGIRGSTTEEVKGVIWEVMTEEYGQF